ncbi:hypothetical protein [Geitlerinema calcuttense]|uniref:Uncharacterized protein n=1 Tax=Geitlerinema calcuttense NRMC-F 0142 TaxID=2922238 RepID=A0ABT7LYE8_9CYAN|nr:hypothetical protein [Geitlerinema calcuttense]MDL5057023.1 hypothetical protein [Geitlerinema calcuttense NRMC-F 0142]
MCCKFFLNDTRRRSPFPTQSAARAFLNPKVEHSLTLIAPEIGEGSCETDAALDRAQAAERHQIELASQFGSKLGSFQEN